MLLSRRVAQDTVEDQRGGAASIEVDGTAGAESCHGLGQLGEGEARLVGRAAVAGHGDQLRVREAERGPWVAALSDVGVELLRACGEALGIGNAIDQAEPVADQQGARLE